jgi:O-antigen/teichoic acid export membrane protein
MVEMVESERTKRVTRNVGWLMLGNTLNRSFFLVAGIFTARYLGTADYGVYSFATFFSFIFATLADGGLQTIAVREVSREKSKADQYFGTVLILKSVMTLLALLLLSFTVILMDLSPTQVQAVYLAMAAFLALSYANTAVAFFRAFERMVFEGVITTLQGVLFVLLVAVGILVRADLLLFVGALLISYVVSVLLAYHWVLTRFARPRFPLDVALTRFLIREAFPIGISLFLFILYGRIGAIVLELQRDSVDVGTFSAAFNLVRNLNFVPMAFTAAILPSLSQSAISDQGRFTQLYTTSFKVMLLLGLPLAVGGMLLADPIVQLVYGPAFAEAGVAFRLIAWSVSLSFLSLLSKATLESTNRQIHWTYALIIGVSVNLALNLLLVPRFGAAGASRALLLADVAIFLVASGFALRVLPRVGKALLKLGFTALGSVSLMGLTLVILKGQPLALTIPVSGLVYLLALILFRLFDGNDLRMLRKAFAAGGVTVAAPGESHSEGEHGRSTSPFNPETMPKDTGKQ